MKLTDEQMELLKATPKQKMLMALTRLGKNVYPGTVPEHVVAKRRAKNKQARLSRRRSRS